MASRVSKVSSPATVASSTFRDAVMSVPSLCNHYCSGLKAMGKESEVVKVLNTSYLEGSVDIDKAVLKLYPESNRWDYVFGYKSEAYFLEIHPVTTGEVKIVIGKKLWLDAWLKSDAKPIDKIKVDGSCFWVATKGVDTLLKQSKYAKMLVQHKIKVVELVRL